MASGSDSFRSAHSAIAVERHATHTQVEDLYILPEFQNQGIGTAIILDIIEEAHQDCKPVRLRVLTSSPAKVLYERLGFVVVHIEPERYFMEYPYLKRIDQTSHAGVWSIIGVLHHQIAMTLENLEAEVLLLPKQSQVTLLARMLERLGQSNEIDQEVSSIWVEEAEMRDRAMDNDETTGIPAEQVFQRVRTSLQWEVSSFIRWQKKNCLMPFPTMRNKNLGLVWSTWTK